ncbi:hypothetical protein R1sor_025179 [Riccia sorocarpa]|uniref:NAD-dependent epimerase/dehydratase domain-containing protein n=1 Tax=Riccia sorocarpa TaxID=122646 RepID=A0ABD3G990_9MARC
MPGKTVAVTGANGFIATWVVKVLLERGYTVRGTTRNPDDSTKVEHLWKLPGAKEQLTLHKAHLLEDGAFDDVFAGVDGIFHIASPVIIKFDDPEKEIILPAVNGTLNVLSSAVKAGTVKRVVLTSSTFAVCVSEAALFPSQPSLVVDESWWSDEEWALKSQRWYAVSKIRAEKAAWNFMKDRKDFDMVVMNPTLVVGPILQNTLNASSGDILSFLNGTFKELPARGQPVGIVHVKDVAMAHILGYENSSANGRYNVAGEAGGQCMTWAEVADILRMLCPECPIPKRPDESGAPQYCPIITTEKIQKLGLVSTPTEEALRDCVTSLREKNWLQG